MLFFFFFKQKTAYEMRISDWSSDVCSSDLPHVETLPDAGECDARKRNHVHEQARHQAARDTDDDGLDEYGFRKTRQPVDRIVFVGNAPELADRKSVV